MVEENSTKKIAASPQSFAPDVAMLGREDLAGCQQRLKGTLRTFVLKDSGFTFGQSVNI
jgi:hypothetical protein